VADGRLCRDPALVDEAPLGDGGRGAASLAATVGMFMVLPMQFQPPRDSDNAYANIEMVPGTTLQQSAAVVRQVADIIRAQPDVESVYERVRVGGGGVNASLREDRKMTSVEFERALAPRLAAIPDARVSFRSQFGWGGSGRDMTIVLGGDDPVLLNQTAQKIVAEMAALPSLQSPRVAGDLTRPEIIIKPRLDLAANLGVTTASLSNAIRIATLGDIDQNSARFSLSDRQIPIRVALDQSARTSCRPSRTCRCRRRPAAPCRSASSPRSGWERGRPRSSASTSSARSRWGRTSRPASWRASRASRSTTCPP
jgi:multidrug efflux pump subunit AcrB